MSDLEEEGNYGENYRTFSKRNAVIEGGCVFCAIGRFEDVESGEVLVDLPSFYIMQPLNPVTDGHVLVIPRRHVTDAAANPELYGVVSRAAAVHASEVGECNIITSVGEAATQTVNHLHIHVVPREEDDGLHLPWTGQKKAEISGATR